MKHKPKKAQFNGLFGNLGITKYLRLSDLKFYDYLDSSNWVCRDRDFRRSKTNNAATKNVAESHQNP